MFLFVLSANRQDRLEMFLCKCTLLHTLGNTCSWFPELLNISSSVSITLPINQSSSYTLMSLYIDLIEHIVDKVLRNPLGALLLSSQQSVIALLRPSNLFLSSSLSFFLHFSPCPLYSIISFPTNISVSTPPLYCFFPYSLSCFLPVSHAVFQSKLHALANPHPSPHLILWVCGAKRAKPSQL